MSGYYLLMNGEFAYNKSYSVGYDFGSIKRLDRYSMGALSTLYICFALTRHNSDFMKVYFDSLKWYKEIYMIAAEGARNHGLLNVPTDEFFATQHVLPQSVDEQIKIAKFLTLIEQRIEKQQRLVDNLKSYKRGVSTALFTQKLQTPHRKSHWEKITLGEIFNERIERAIGTEKLLAVTISNGIQDREDLDLKNNASDDKRNYRVVCINDLAYNTMRMWQGACGVSAYNGIVSPAYTVMYISHPREYYMPYFGYLFKEVSMLHIFQKNSQGLTSDTWNLKYDKFAKITVDVPHFEEQKYIATLLDKVASVISKQERLLDTLLIYKRSLLNDLFI